MIHSISAQECPLTVGFATHFSLLFFQYRSCSVLYHKFLVSLKSSGASALKRTVSRLSCAHRKRRRSKNWKLYEWPSACSAPPACLVTPPAFLGRQNDGTLRGRIFAPVSASSSDASLMSVPAEMHSTRCNCWTPLLSRVSGFSSCVSLIFLSHCYPFHQLL